MDKKLPDGLPSDYEKLIDKILITSSDTPYSARDFLPVCYQYDQELLSPGIQEQFLRLAGGGRVDSTTPFSLSFRPADSILLLSSIQGSGEFAFRSPEKSTHPISSGSILIFDCTTGFSLRSLELPWSFRVFFLNASGLEPFRPLLNQFFSASASANPVMAFSVEELGSLPEKADPASLLRMHRLLTDILAEAALSSLPRRQKSFPKIPAYLQDLHRYIHDCANLSFSLAELEALYGVSRYRLCREYREAFRISPLKDFNRVRIREAKKLLLNTNLQVQEISSRLGYENINHFVHLFKAETGTTPGAFRSGQS